MEPEIIPIEEELYEHLKITVDKGQVPIRIDKFLFNKNEKISRNRIQNSILAGSLLVNKNEIKASYKVRPGDVITLVLATPPREIKIIPEDILLKIIYEDDDIIIVDKPAGMVVHPALGNYSGTLLNALSYRFQNLPQSNFKTHQPTTHSQPSVLRPGLVHRIDKNTSGLLVVTKNEIAMDFLAKQFFHHTIKRTYLALVWGDFKEDRGTISGHIGRSLKNRKMMAVFPEGEHGKSAVTHYKVIERIGYVSLVECKLETGRTHQIRVHMKYIGHPVFNDNEYGGNKIVKGTVFTKYKQFVENCFKIIPRQALHAKSLGFIHPSTRQEVYFESPLPEDFKQVLEKWKKYIRER